MGLDCSSTPNNIKTCSFIRGSKSPVLPLSTCVQVRGFVTVAEPYSGCTEITNAEYVQGHIALLQRGQCMFAEKARHIQKAGAIGGIVIGECKRHKTEDDYSMTR